MDANNNLQQSYFTVIPATVRKDDALSTNAKILYGDIVALANVNGYCYASNQYFAQSFGLTERSVTRLISKLEERGHIRVRIVRDKKTGLVTGRRIYPQFNAPVTDEEDAPEDAAIHPTILSGRPDNIVQIHPTKMSGQLNSINNTYVDNISPCNPPEEQQNKKRIRRKDDTEARQAISVWLDKHHLSGNNILHDKLMDFCDARLASKAGALSAKAANLMLSRLMDYSDGSVAVMLAILDNSIINNWAGVFPLKADERRRLGLAAAPAQPAAPDEDGGVYLCL